MSYPDQLTFHSFTVVTFDMCSSSNVIESLTLTGGLAKYSEVMNRLKDFIRGRAKHYQLIPYKFVGDGWILLFPETVGGDRIVDFIEKMSRHFVGLCNTKLLPFLEHHPKPWGLTFGIESGALGRTVMMSKFEYFGRPLTIACRLQGAIKDRDRDPSFKILMSQTFFARHREVLRTYRHHFVRRKLRNINGGSEFRCVKLEVNIKK